MLKKLRPTEGRYKFLSLNKSARGKKLLVGERVMKNHNKEKAATGETQRKFLIKTSRTISQIEIGNKLGEINQWAGKS